MTHLSQALDIFVASDWFRIPTRNKDISSSFVAGVPISCSTKVDQRSTRSTRSTRLEKPNARPISSIVILGHAAWPAYDHFHFISSHQINVVGRFVFRPDK